ncbi:xylulose kinase [Ditylenchus destructor]|nr:xylulose kinase [Ditylenchus destructor]
MYLGLDLGTSGVKALLIDGEQKLIGSAHGELDVSRPHPGWSEQDPAQWIKACEAAIDGLRAAHPKEFAAVAGIGLSGQMHGATLLGENDQVLRPAFSGMTHAAIKRLPNSMPIRPSVPKPGNIVFPGLPHPNSSGWRATNQIFFARTRKVLLPKDYLRLWLTGEHVSDMSDSLAQAGLIPAHAKWSSDLLSKTGLTENHMPKLAEGSDATGILRAELQRALGKFQRSCRCRWCG